jgi:hypothetical protein
LAELAEATGVQVLDDGSHFQLAPEKCFHDASPRWSSPNGWPG